MAENATTPDEVPNPPRKVSWKRWTLAAACVLAIALVVLFLGSPGRERVSIRFVGITNYHGQSRLMFKGTNGLPNAIKYDAWAFRTANGATPTDLASISGSSSRIASVGAREAFAFELDAPAEGPSWRMGWTYYAPPHPRTRWEQTKFRCYVFLNQHRMHSLAGLFGDRLRINYISPANLKD